MNTKVIHKNSEVTIIIPEGELDVYNSPFLKEMIDREIEAGYKKFLIDLGMVTYIDSSALGLLVSELKSLRRRNGVLKLSNLQGNVNKVFQLTRLSQFFEIYNSADEALVSFGA